MSLIRRVLREAAPDAIALAHGTPSHPVPEPVREALRLAIERGDAFGYTDNAGSEDLRAAIARRRPHHGGAADSVIVTPGSQGALALAILGLAGEGDEVLIPELAYPSYEALARFAGATVVGAPQGRQAAAGGARTRLAVVASPANPTGAIAPAGALAQLAALADERGFHLVADEIYEELWLGEELPAHATGARVVHIGGISKSVGAPGLRLGWLIADPRTVEVLLPLQQHLVTCAPSLSQAAALAALALPRECLEAIRDHYRRRWRTARRALRALPRQAFWQEPAGAFYVLLDVGGVTGPDTVAFALRLAREGVVVVVPGEAFGPAGAGKLRVSFSAAEERIEEGIARLAEALSRHGSDARRA